MLSKRKISKNNKQHESPTRNVKRICKRPEIEKRLEQCSEIIWPDTEEDSFLSNLKLDEIMTHSNTNRRCNSRSSSNDSYDIQNGQTLLTFTSSSSRSSRSSDSQKNSNSGVVNKSLFCDIELQLSEATSQEAIELTQRPIFPSEPMTNDTFFSKLTMPIEDLPILDEDAKDVVLKKEQVFNDTLFSVVDLEDLTQKEVEDVFSEAEMKSDEIQNTQKFLDDIASILPQEQIIMAPVNNDNVKNEVVTSMNDTTVFASILEGIIQGSDYKTAEELQQIQMEAVDHKKSVLKTLRQTQKLSLTKNKTQKKKTEPVKPPSPSSPPPQQILKAEKAPAMNISEWNLETQAFNDVPLTIANNFPSKGNFYGLPVQVKNLIFKHKGIKSLYEWQDECLNLPAIKKRKNLIYALPTSGGKTLVAEILMLRDIICREKNVLFILPYVSIVQEKINAMAPIAIAMDFIVDEYTAGKGKCPPVARRKRRSLFVASIEKGAVLMDSLIEAGRANEISLVVVDELHLIGERGRGATLESLLTKVMFLKANIQIVGMSATIGNLSDISTFLNADVYTRGFRPVELKEYVKCGNDILEINSSGKTPEETFIYNRSVNFNYSPAVLRTDPDHLGGLVAECAPEHGCLVFCPSKKNCENVALLLSRILPKTKFLEYRKTEKADLMDALDKVCGILSSVLAKTIPYGIVYHHSGLTTDERRFIETAYRFGVVSVICCTSTLAAGVNLPAKRVIIRAPYVGVEFMTLSKYKQMVGRAGRAGMGDAGESILISSPKDNVRIGQMLYSPMDKALSSLDFNDCLGLQGLIISAIGLGLAMCCRDLLRFIESTLLSVQAKSSGLNIEELMLQQIREMFKNKVLELTCPPIAVDSLSDQAANGTCFNVVKTQSVTEEKPSINSTDTRKTEQRLYIKRSSRFQLTKIGRAAFKAGIDYKRAYIIHNELQKAQQKLLLGNFAHLLYLVVCFNSNENGNELFPADPGILFRLYNTMDDSLRALFTLLGFTEAHAMKIARTLSIQGPFQVKLNRLYKVLILQDILDLMPIPSVSAKYNVERGTLQNLISQSTAAGSAIVRLCEQIESFWCFQPLFEKLIGKMDRCGTLELEPLLELPAVKINRARQLYAAGFQTIEDIAKCRPIQLVRNVEHVSMKLAKELISAAKIIVMNKLDHLEGETELLKTCLIPLTEEDSQ